MYGAILGDIIGSPYEFDRGSKSKDFPLFSKHSILTKTCMKAENNRASIFPGIKLYPWDILRKNGFG